jgi:hypothetical protein
MPTPQSTSEEMLAYWKGLAGDDSPYPWESANTGMFFQIFRPHGLGVEAAFEGVVLAEEILPRLMEVYEATADGWQRDGAHDAYFVVRNPKPLTAGRAEALCREYLAKVGEIADRFEVPEGDNPVNYVKALVHPSALLKVVQGERPWPPHRDSPEGVVYQVVGEFMSHLQWDLAPVESHAYLMEEGFYTLACDYNLAYHLLWPTYRDLADITEPFAAYFELWKHGAGCRFEDDGGVTLYVPNLEA